MGLHREIRGAMTRFEPLTEQALQERGLESLTLAELKDALAQQGMSLEYVVHDPSRTFQNTFYADYDRGLYCEIYLQRSSLGELLKIGLMNYREKNGRCKFLEDGDWRRFYGVCVPVPMSIYDFQRRYRDIPPDEVFSVWHLIYRRIDYTNGMWPPEVLRDVFDHAPKPVLPEHSGRITIYRGMGSSSIPAEDAISWSTSPINALWFAYHSGRGTGLAVGQIEPEKIVAYFPGAQNENEIILRPGTEMDIHWADMIPCTKAMFEKLILPTLSDFVCYGSQVKALEYPEEITPFDFHGRNHILRVLMLSLIYYYNSGDSLDAEDKNILIYFSLLHDLGRTSECEDVTHGLKSVELIHKRGIRLRGLPLTPKGYKIAECIIRCHCISVEEGLALIRQEMPTRKDRLRAEHLFNVCKDMDGLDRVRLNDLDYRMLRTDFARRLPLITGGLLREDVPKIIELADGIKKAGAGKG